MPRLEIAVCDHKGREGFQQSSGPCIHNYRCGWWDKELPPCYADFRVLDAKWRYHTGPPPAFIGFFGYRKYLGVPGLPIVNPEPAHALGWFNLTKENFNYYRDQWAKYDGAPLLPLLATYDIITAPPFPLGINLITDFAQSRSDHDADMLRDTLRDYGWVSSSMHINAYIFITRWEVFNRFMEEVEDLRRDLYAKITAEDSKDKAYTERPMAYIMERLFSLWLEQSGLSATTLPLLHCWEL